MHGILTVSVSAIFFNNFFKDLVPNGFLGVDSIFVLAGYTLMSIMSTKKPHSTTLITQFRFLITSCIRNYLPLYYFTILLTRMAMKFHVVKKLVYWNAFVKSSLFQSNDEIHNPFSQLSYISVLVQCACLALIVFLILLNNPKLIQMCFIAISIFSFQFMSDDSYFENKFQGRMWQFLIGCLAQNLLEHRYNRVGIFSGIFMSLVLIFPGDLSMVKIWVRILVCLLTAFSCHHLQILSKNRVLLYLDNFSYKLYLIHWPLYFIAEFYSHNFTVFSGLALISAAILHEIYERFARKRTDFAMLILSIVEILICVLYFYIN
ncbi:unnamed protein product [Caenorhabditis angaria]|uniref:Acyltransferase 3 domain-containing protein n=1 Tax=Caenorhabditis angaria TaxID=860376 RepID=A0A9P1NAC1_9PELO|nr:unnamed protein product [Caenorhabditis angaria]